MRGNNTNNYIEAQFLVIKDKILNRVKEYNVVGLFKKLAVDLENHYKDKLISVTTGSFDAVYSPRYKGQLKGIPPGYKLDEVVKGISTVGQELFIVPSFTTAGISYMVDMNVCICECTKGCNSAPCKHQNVLWSLQFSTHASNFLPVFSPMEKND